MTGLEERLKSRWSPYQLNIGGLGLFGLLGAVTLIGFLLLPRSALALVAIPFFAALLAPNWLFLIGACPICTKSPMQRQYGSGWAATILRRKLLWPERKCSACGQDLTMVPRHD